MTPRRMIVVPKPARRRGYMSTGRSRLAEKLIHKRTQLGLTQKECVQLVCDTIGPISLRSWCYAEEGMIRKPGPCNAIFKVFLAKPYKRERRADGSLVVREV